MAIPPDLARGFLLLSVEGYHLPMTSQDAISLTRDLLRFDTTNPPGRQRDCAQMAGARLQEWGVAVQYSDSPERRTSVDARLGTSDRNAPLCLTAHLAAVP